MPHTSRIPRNRREAVNTTTSIRVEFFGIPRRRAGVAETTVAIEGPTVRLGTIVAELAARFPELAKECFQGEQLRPTVAANVSGREFLSDPDARLRAGDSLLLLSADGGG